MGFLRQAGKLASWASQTSKARFSVRAPASVNIMESNRERYLKLTLTSALHIHTLDTPHPHNQPMKYKYPKQRAFRC